MTADLDLLGDEDADGLGSTAAAGAGGAVGRSSMAGGAAAAGGGGAGGGHQQERGGLTEAQSFTDLAYSKNKVGYSSLLAKHCAIQQRLGSIQLKHSTRDQWHLVHHGGWNAMLGRKNCLVKCC